MVTQVMVSPDWFLSKDLIINALSVLILLLIAAFCIRCYFFHKREKKSYLLFGASFTLMAISFMWKIATGLTIYTEVIHTKKLGMLVISYKTLKASKLLFVAGHFAHYILMLIGLYILYTMLNEKSTVNHLLILYFIFITTTFSNFSYYMFHLTALVLLGAISYRYYRLWQKNKRKLTKLILASFIVLAVSQAVFMLVKYDTNAFVVAQIIQLAGFLLLLLAFILVLNYGKKKSKRYHK